MVGSADHIEEELGRRSVHGDLGRARARDFALPATRVSRWW
jgi:hypothetical protein